MITDLVDRPENLSGPRNSTFFTKTRTSRSDVSSCGMRTTPHPKTGIDEGPHKEPSFRPACPCFGRKSKLLVWPLNLWSSKKIWNAGRKCSRTLERIRKKSVGHNVCPSGRNRIVSSEGINIYKVFGTNNTKFEMSSNFILQKHLKLPRICSASMIFCDSLLQIALFMYRFVPGFVIPCLAVS